MGHILRKLNESELAEIQELTKAHDRSKKEAEAAQKRVGEDQTLINAWVVRIKRTYDLQDTDHIRVDSGDIVRADDGVIPPPAENG